MAAFRSILVALIGLLLLTAAAAQDTKPDGDPTTAAEQQLAEQRLKFMMDALGRCDG